MASVNSYSKKNIPFFGNTSDGTHCYQAALKMVLTFFTQKEWPFEKLDQISKKIQGKWTWPTASMLWLLDHDYQIKLIEEFSYEAFAKRGKNYLIEKCGQEVADAQEANSDLKVEQQLAAQFAKKVPIDFRIPDWGDLQSFLKEGYLMICNINAALLYNQAGYSGHFVVPIRFSKEALWIHDPGLPPAHDLKVSKESFEKAWGYPTFHERNILAIKPFKS